MIFNQCLVHPKEQCQFICLHPHECQKKLCLQCLKEHKDKILGMQFSQENDFINNLNEMFDTFYFNSQLDQSYKILVKEVNEVEQLYQMLFKRIKLSLWILFTSLKKYNEQYEYTIEKLREFKIEKLTKEDLKILTSPEICTQLISQNKLKQDFANKLIDRLNSLEKELKQFYCSIMKQVYQNVHVEEKQRINSGKKISYQIEGDEHFGFKHGIYLFKNQFHNQPQKAGCYFLNKKDGFWTESNFQIQSQGFYNMGLKVKEWEYFCNNELISKQQYNEEGQKQGEWRDIFVNQFFYYEMNMIIAWGQYQGGLRTGEWSYIRKVNNDIDCIGGGIYDQEGRKVGFWKDVSENIVMKHLNIIWEGYYEKGVRIGEWRIFCDIGQNQRQSKQMVFNGGGIYDSGGLKFGQWREIYGEEDAENSRCFQILLDTIIQAQIFFEGKYEQGLKVGEWKILQKTDQGSFQIGGGSYNKIGQKNGVWREPDLNCKQERGSFHIFLEGQYLDGVKIGQWAIYLQKKAIIIPIIPIMRNKMHLYLSPGGNFNNKGQKNGQWEECLSYCGSYIQIWKGQYQSGVRYGLCNFLALDYFKTTDSYFSYSYGIGQYDENGKKTKRWIKKDGQNEKFWVGQYNEGKKTGQWKLKENSLEFPFNCLINFDQCFNVGYDEKGQKNGVWKIIQKQRNQKIQNQHLSRIKFFVQIIKEGEYQNGVKIGE